MFESLAPIIDWLKEYGDVLGGIGSIFALTTLALTNGKVIMQRVRGEESSPPALGIAPDGGALEHRDLAGNTESLPDKNSGETNIKNIHALIRSFTRTIHLSDQAFPILLTISRPDAFFTFSYFT